jgi:hypothetical protein
VHDGGAGRPARAGWKSASCFCTQTFFAAQKAGCAAGGCAGAGPWYKSTQKKGLLTEFSQNTHTTLDTLHRAMCGFPCHGVSDYMELDMTENGPPEGRHRIARIYGGVGPPPI